MLRELFNQNSAMRVIWTVSRFKVYYSLQILWSTTQWSLDAKYFAQNSLRSTSWVQLVMTVTNWIQNNQVFSYAPDHRYFEVNVCCLSKTLTSFNGHWARFLFYSGFAFTGNPGMDTRSNFKLPMSARWKEISNCHGYKHKEYQWQCLRQTHW